MTDETKGEKKEATRLVGIQDLDPLALFGKNDSNLRLVERSYPVHLTYRDGSLAVRGEPTTVDEVAAILGSLAELVRKGAILEEHDVHNFIGVSDADEREESLQIYERPVLFSFDKRTLRVKTLGQARYVSALQKHDIVFAIGPAGTGKTYLAVAAAVHALKSRQVERILLVRPAVALRRAQRPSLVREDPALPGPRRDRGRAARVHARAHAQQRLRHPGRGPEHDRGADEDVPHAPGLWLEGGDHR